MKQQRKVRNTFLALVAFSLVGVVERFTGALSSHIYLHLGSFVGSYETVQYIVRATCGLLIASATVRILLLVRKAKDD